MVDDDHPAKVSLFPCNTFSIAQKPPTCVGWATALIRRGRNRLPFTNDQIQGCTIGCSQRKFLEPMTPAAMQATVAARLGAPMEGGPQTPPPKIDLGTLNGRYVFDFSEIPEYGPLPLIAIDADPAPVSYRPITRALVSGFAAALMIGLSVGAWSTFSIKMRMASALEVAAEAEASASLGLRPGYR